MILGELGNGAQAIYDTVHDPQASIVELLGALFGLGGLSKIARDEKSLGELALKRATIKADTIKNFGKLFQDNDVHLQGILNMCKR